MINIGGSKYEITDAFREAVEVLDGVASDPGVAIGSPGERLNTEKALLVQTKKKQLAQRAITATDYQVQFVPTEYSTLPKYVAVLEQELPQ